MIEQNCFLDPFRISKMELHVGKDSCQNGPHLLQCRKVILISVSGSTKKKAGSRWRSQHTPKIFKHEEALSKRELEGSFDLKSHLQGLGRYLLCRHESQVQISNTYHKKILSVASGICVSSMRVWVGAPTPTYMWIYICTPKCTHTYILPTHTHNRYTYICYAQYTHIHTYIIYIIYYKSYIVVNCLPWVLWTKLGSSARAFTTVWEFRGQNFTKGGEKNTFRAAGLRKFLFYLRTRLFLSEGK